MKRTYYYAMVDAQR